MHKSLIFCIGGIIQVVNTGSIGAIYAGRAICGFGVGMATTIVPIFSGEMAPATLRGPMGACFQMFYAFGACTSYW
jgi:MFS family permease